MNIYVQKEGQQRGPFTETRLRAGIDSGEFNPADLAWRTDTASWRPLSALIDLDKTQPPTFGGADAISRSVYSAQTVPLPASNTPRAPESTALPKATSNVERPSTSKFESPLKVNGNEITGLDKKSDFKILYLVACIIVFVVFKIWLANLYPDQGNSPLLKDLKSRSQNNGYNNVHELPVKAADQLALRPFEPKPLFPQREPLGSAKAGLRSGQGEFTSAYGKPAREGVGITTPADKTMLLDTKWDLAYAVSFWNDVAHHIDIWRWDKEKLTEQDIKKALESFAGGEQWNRSYRNILFGEVRWERDGAAAWLIANRENQDPPTDKNTPVNSLRITTTEFWEAHKKAEGF